MSLDNKKSSQQDMLSKYVVKDQPPDVNIRWWCRPNFFNFYVK